jgi:hypothetical protein
MKPLSIRFFAGIKKGCAGGCWEWQKSLNHKGYGQMSRGRRGERPITTHRASWLIHFGPIPEGMMVLHKCDNRKCVNPAHLFVGTAKDNTADMFNKGRGSEGDRHPNAKITAKIAIRIRRLRTGGFRPMQIARRLKLPPGVVRHVCQGTTWKRAVAA